LAANGDGHPPRADNSRPFEGRAALAVGSPQEVIDKILFQHELFRHDRYLAQFSVGTLPHGQIMRSIELLGARVAPVVRAEIARRATV
jgi:alkanesulfonate monooxygenase SsuD/methylene tetrahydromethanopterin reductase-like flavin-dependent oxidoreductase (luciferase family)